MSFTWEIYDNNALNLVLHSDCDNSLLSDIHFASVNVGNLCAELITCEFTNEPVSPVNVNVYLLGKDGGYGETKSGTPYDLLDCYFTIPCCNNIEEFKKQVEQAFKEMIIENNLSEEANKPLGNWN